MSARSRALNDLANHYRKLAESARRDETPDPDVPPLFSDLLRGVRRTRARPIYTGSESWDNAAEMARRTAREATWTYRIWHAFIAEWLYIATCAVVDWCAERGHEDARWWMRALTWAEDKLGGIA